MANGISQRFLSIFSTGIFKSDEDILFTTCTLQLNLMHWTINVGCFIWESEDYVLFVRCVWLKHTFSLALLTQFIDILQYYMGTMNVRSPLNIVFVGIIYHFILFGECVLCMTSLFTYKLPGKCVYKKRHRNYPLIHTYKRGRGWTERNVWRRVTSTAFGIPNRINDWIKE